MWRRVILTSSPGAKKPWRSLASGTAPNPAFASSAAAVPSPRAETRGARHGQGDGQSGSVSSMSALKKTYSSWFCHPARFRR